MVSYNGSADLRSPEKEVCFRSWDLANSQMCEVRVATSNICGCNPPNRCGERSGADFATSFCGLAKVAIFTTNVDAENQTLINHKCVCGALNRHFCQTAVHVAQLKYTKNLYKNGIFRKFMYARKEEFYTTIICFGQFIRPSSRG